MRPNPQFPADWVTFTKEILNGKLHFLYSGICSLALLHTKNRDIILRSGIEISKIIFP